MLGALLVPLVGARLRPLVVLGLPLVALAQVWLVADGPALEVAFLDYRLTVFQGDALSRFFATIFCIMAFGGGLYAINQRSVVELAAAQAYAGAAVGVAMAGDLFSFFVFWELMAVASTLVVWGGRDRGRLPAARRYVMVHLIGGVVLMAESPPTWRRRARSRSRHGARKRRPMADPRRDSRERGRAAAFGMGAGTPTRGLVLGRGVPVRLHHQGRRLRAVAYVRRRRDIDLRRPLHGVYGIIYALLENDMRRILAYSIVNQVGFMVTGIGIGTEMALNGSAAHAFAHIIYKALLLMSAGAVLHQTGRRKCTERAGCSRACP